MPEAVVAEVGEVLLADLLVPHRGVLPAVAVPVVLPAVTVALEAGLMILPVQPKVSTQLRQPTQVRLLNQIGVKLEEGLAAVLLLDRLIDRR